MERHFDRDMGLLKERLLEMGGAVEQTIASASRALLERDSELARKIILEDDRIDRRELEIDEAIVELLSRMAPVARDLRLVVAISRITPELERIADLSVDVAERALELNREPPLKPLVDIPRMATIAGEMLRASLDAFVRNDVTLAQATIIRDDEVDALMESVFRELLTYMMENPKNISRAIRLTFVAKYFERIADSATNICEQVVFEVEGRVLKHAERPEG
jgi:phosphate transport system protein